MAKIHHSTTPVAALADKTLTFPKPKSTTCLACGTLYAYIMVDPKAVKCPTCEAPLGSKVIPHSGTLNPDLDDPMDHWPPEEEKGWDPDAWHPNHPDSIVLQPPEMHYVAGQLKPVIPINLPAGDGYAGTNSGNRAAR